MVPPDHDRAKDLGGIRKGGIGGVRVKTDGGGRSTFLANTDPKKGGPTNPGGEKGT